MKNVEKFVLSIAFLLIMSGTARTTTAATYLGSDYGLTATTLGDNYSLTTDASGYITAVTNADGTQTYQFDKYPVIHQLVQLTPNPNDDPMVAHDVVYQAMHNQYGSVNFDYERYGSYSDSGASIYGGLNNWGLPGLQSPVADFNIHGAVVGSSGPGAAATTQFGYLQDDFPAIPGLVFSNAFMIADSGQILVSGTLDGQPQYFLVTQGQPVLAPEPSTLAILVCALAILGRRRLGHDRATFSEAGS